MAEITPGFRFYPTEEELICFYLHNKLEGTRQDINCVIPMINVFDLEPWDLPKFSGELCAGETEQWFFFVPRQEREARGGRPCRITAAGYWKATGSPSYVYSSENKVIGLKKSMVFYKGKSPSGKKTKWKMNEYRAIEEHLPSYPTALPFPKLRHEMSLCRVYVILRNFGSFDRRPIIGNNMTSCRYTTIPSQEHVENRGSQQEVKMMMAIKCSESSVIVQEEDDDFDDDHHMMDVFATTGLTMVKSSELNDLERLIHF